MTKKISTLPVAGIDRLLPVPRPGPAGSAECTGRYHQALRQKTASWLALDVSDEAHWGMALVREGQVQGCGQMAALQAVDAAWCRQNVAGLTADGQRRWYSEPLTYPGRVFVFGGGHVSQALVPVLASIGFSCIVVDDRAEFADPALFPRPMPSIKLIMKPFRRTSA